MAMELATIHLWLPMMVCKTVSNSQEMLPYFSMACLGYTEQLLEMVSLNVIVSLIGSTTNHVLKELRFISWFILTNDTYLQLNIKMLVKLLCLCLSLINTSYIMSISFFMLVMRRKVIVFIIHTSYSLITFTSSIVRVSDENFLTM